MVLQGGYSWERTNWESRREVWWCSHKKTKEGGRHCSCDRKEKKKIELGERRGQHKPNRVSRVTLLTPSN